MRLIPIGALAIALSSLFASASASALAAKSVAVSVSGTKGSGEDKLDAKIRGQLTQRGLEVVSERAVEKAAKKIHQEADTAAAAQEAGADLWISITVKKVKKKFVAVAKLIELSSGKTIKNTKRSYKKPSSAAAIGDLLGTELAEAAAGGGSGAVASHQGAQNDDDEAADDDEKPAQQHASGKIVKPKDDEAPHEAAPRRSEPTVTPKDEERNATGVSTSVSPAGSGGNNGENKVLHLVLGGGSQVTSAYTVAVGPQVTGLAYKLTPLVLLDAAVGVQIPNIGLGFELGLAFVPVKYQIEVDPAVDPAAPKGRFLDVSGAAFYRLNLASFGDGGQSRFYLAPQLGFQYSSLDVEAQDPYAVVLSWSAVAPFVGARAGIMLDALALELDGRFKFIVSYGESPDSTGDGGSGTGVLIGATARYWASEHFGVTFRLAYDFSSISFSGEGTRTPFVDDPPLQDASAYSSDLRAAFGVVLAL